MALFGRTRPVLDDPYFGRLTFMRGGYWEGELIVPGVSEKVGLVVPASDTGPSAEQAAFCRRRLADLDALFARCRPVFDGDLGGLSFLKWSVGFGYGLSTQPARQSES